MWKLVQFHDPRCPRWVPPDDVLVKPSRQDGVTSCGREECIQDGERFVHRAINKARLVVGDDEREELVAEGLAILHRLHRDYRPHIEGHDRDNGRFSGYAAMYLPRKLGDAWHKLHPEHLLVQDKAEGRRRWQYTERPVSLTAVTWDDEEDRERPVPDALQVTDEPDDMEERLRAALQERWVSKVGMYVEIAHLLSRNYSESEVSSELGVTMDFVREAVEEIKKTVSKQKIGRAA